jgi:hypothetical protein
MTGTKSVTGIMSDFMVKGESFTAFDVTKELRADGQDARHYKVKSDVHRVFLNGGMSPFGYTRTLVTLDLGNDDADAFVYHDQTVDPYNYPLAKKQTVGVPVADGDNTDAGDDEDAEPDVVATVKVVTENRVQIPKKVLQKLDTSKQVLKSYDISCNGRDYYGRFPESDGRVRITAADIPVGTKLNLKIENNTVHISPA